MKHSKHAILLAIRIINEQTAEQVDEDYIGLPKALRMCAVDVLLDDERRTPNSPWVYSVEIVTNALKDLKVLGYIDFGDLDTLQ